MKKLIDTIETNFDLFDFLSHKYENYNLYGGIKLNSYYSEISFDKSLLKQFRDKINWYKVSLEAPLTEDLIDEFFEELRECRIITGNGPAHECLFSQNTNINWTESILDKYKKHLHWKSIFENPSVQWNEYLIDKYLFNTENDKWYWINLSSNPGIIWNEKLIKKYHSYLYVNCLIKYSKIFWDTRLLNTTLQLIELENQKLYLIYFSEITNIKWDFETIISYPNSYSYWLRNIIKNRTIDLNFEILRKYRNQMDKSLFAIIQVSEDLVWNTELITEFLSLIDFDILSKSNNVKWTINLVDSFQKYLNFKILSSNYNIIITKKLLKKYSDKWDFKSLSINKSVCWDIETMEHYIERIDLDEIITNSKIKFTAEFIEKYKNKFTWNGRWRKFGSDNEKYDASEISQQRHLPISIQTLSEMATKWGVGCTEWSGRIDDIKEWHFYSDNSNLTPEHLSNFKEFLSWEILSKNKELQISMQTLSIYAEKWDYYEIFRRDDIEWDIEGFCKISFYLNWDILKANESKILEILKIEENTILNYFKFIKSHKLPIHREVWGSFRLDSVEREIRISKMKDICSEAINESKLLKLDDHSQLWEWLKKYINFYYENTDLTPSLKRLPKSYSFYNRQIKTDSIRIFIAEYERNKIKFDRIYKEGRLH
jgi:hypothetical protein